MAMAIDQARRKNALQLLYIIASLVHFYNIFYYTIISSNQHTLIVQQSIPIKQLVSPEFFITHFVKFKKWKFKSQKFILVTFADLIGIKIFTLEFHYYVRQIRSHKSKVRSIGCCTHQPCYSRQQ